MKLDILAFGAHPDDVELSAAGTLLHYIAQGKSVGIVDLTEGELGTITVLVPGDWGHLPQKMADDLTEATRTEAAPEYRAAIESYYKAIAQKAKK